MTWNIGRQQDLTVVYEYDALTPLASEQAMEEHLGQGR